MEQSPQTHAYLMKGGALIGPDCLYPMADVWIENGRIRAWSETPLDIPGAEIIDASGHYIAPGFIDMHVHGGGGQDVMDASVQAYLTMAQVHAQHGTTAMLPTTLSGDREGLEASLKMYPLAHAQNSQGARFLGMHLEGPYIALSQKGAQEAQYIRPPDPEEYRELLERYPFIKRWSAAPELPGALAFGDYLQSKGVLVALAHTDALCSEVMEAHQHGYRLATHFYSAMSSVHRKNAYRLAGAVEACYLLEEMDVEIIADGAHLPKELLQLIYQFKGPKRMALITDAMRAAGMPAGPSILGNKDKGLPVMVEDGVAKLMDRSAFAGSVATADRLLQTMVHGAGLPLLDVIQMMSAVPARILGLSQETGSIQAGLSADLILLNTQLEVNLTMVQGRVVFRK